MNIDTQLKVNRVTGSVTEWYYMPVAAHIYKVARVEWIAGQWVASGERGQWIAEGADHKAIEAAAEAYAAKIGESLPAYAFTQGIITLTQFGSIMDERMGREH